MTLAVPREEATVILTMDVSRSMTRDRRRPDPARGRQGRRHGLRRQPARRVPIGLVAFSTDARLVVQPTTDRGQLRDAIDSLGADGGTALGDAIALSVDATADARSVTLRDRHRRRRPVGLAVRRTRGEPRPERIRRS